MSVESGEEGAPGRPAAGRVVELGESQAVFRHGIEMRCLNFTAVATEVGIAQVISHDEKEVGRFALTCEY